MAISRQAGDVRALALALVSLGFATQRVQHDPIQAQAIFDEMMALSREAGSPASSVFVAFNLARAANMRGDMLTARQKFEESASLFRSLGNRRMGLSSLSELAHGLRQHGLLDEALGYYRESLPG